MNQPTNAQQALQKRDENGGKATSTLGDQIRQMEKAYQLAMPKGTEAAQLIRDALTALRTTRNLDRCEPASVLGALMTCAQLGLRPGVLGHAWLIPFWDRKSGGHKAQLVIGYQGLVDLAYRSGHVASVIARTAYENDVFEVDYGVADTIIHKPNMDGSRGRAIAYYAIVKYHGGGYAFWVMSDQEMRSYRDQHATAKTKEGKVFGPWVDHYEGMAHKTVLRRLAKFMPKSVELANAIAADESIRVDLNPNTEAAEAAEFVDGEVVNDEDATEAAA
jgi:recombination protein RecT